MRLKHALGLIVTALCLSLLPTALAMPPQAPLLDDASPPVTPVKLIFVHHSTGGNWLADAGAHENAGGLGRALMESNYFVSATNYGWEAAGDAIGDRTDIGNWWEWFAGPSSVAFMSALYAESGQNIGDFGAWPRLADPGGENQIIMFKSCFPNSHLGGSPSDAATAGDNPLRGMDAWAEDVHTVANAKGIYNDILAAFQAHPDKLFVVITAPPLLRSDTDARHAANARALNDWLVHEWLAGYPAANVAVFDFYSVLTSNGGSPTANDLGAQGGNHHRYREGAIEHVHPVANDYLAYGVGGDSHPTGAGGLKATGEFVPWLNVAYNRWRATAPSAPPSSPTRQAPAPTEPAPTSAPLAATAAPLDLETLSASDGRIVLQQGVSPDASYAGCSDAFISREEAQVNVGHLENLETFWGDEEARRSLLRFELPTLPTDAHVVEARLELYRYDGDAADEMVVRAYRVTAPWGEGTGWNLWPEGAYQADGVTWLSASPGAPWSAPGGDYDAASLSGETALAAGMANGWVTLDVTEIAREWLEGGAPNHGLLVRPESGQYTFHYYASSQHERAEWRPRLTILFGEGEAPVAPAPTESPAPAVATATSRPPSVTPEPRATSTDPLEEPIEMGPIRLPLIFKGDPRPAPRAIAQRANATLAAPAPPATATMPESARRGSDPTGRIQPEDLAYLGAFRLPADGGEYGWPWSGHALAYRPDGDPQGGGDGYPGSLYGTGHNHQQQVSEISIPAPVEARPGQLESLNTAATLQGFSDIRGDLYDGIEGFDDFAGCIPKAGLAYLADSAGSRLHFCWAYHLQFAPRHAPDALQGQPEPSHGWRSPDLSDGPSLGAYKVGDYINYVTNDYLFNVDPSWAEQHTPGMRLATGRLRDGGQGGRGPSLIVYDPGDGTDSPPAGEALPAQALLLYSTITAEDDHTADDYAHADEWSGGAWLTDGERGAVIFVGTKGVGRIWYGYGDGTVWPEEPPFPPEPEGERGWFAEQFVGRILFYDTNDLAAVARGEMAPYEPQPYAWLDVEDRLLGDHQAWHHLGACAFDREGGFLYVLEPLVDEDRPVVHVWQVG